ncbi:hypothetical protein [Leucobacter japonicus]|uniref:hypothetical protein n=1 Tax=Leucobacter japonicus TaxID=1461259 RepID=UPI0006A790CF|nr:hypothetical protein [Leucobacter japonicus]
MIDPRQTPLEAQQAPPDLDFVLACVHDDAVAGRFADWGRSTVIDEHTGVASFDRELFEVLHAAAGISAEFPIGNAGVMHVYGYWFSEVPTPFGFKRDRWLHGEVARAFGLAPDAFHLTRGAADGSTPLQRLSRVALPALRSPAPGTPEGNALIGDGASRVVFAQVAGDVEEPGGASGGAGFTDAAGVISGGSPALIYGIAPTAGAPLQLITAFPFGGEVEALIAEFEGEPTARWNAAIDS